MLVTRWLGSAAVSGGASGADVSVDDAPTCPRAALEDDPASDDGSSLDGATGVALELAVDDVACDATELLLVARCCLGGFP